MVTQEPHIVSKKSKKKKNKSDDSVAEIGTLIDFTNILKNSLQLSNCFFDNIGTALNNSTVESQEDEEETSLQTPSKKSKKDKAKSPTKAASGNIKL
jgi:hypothetical protein